MKPSTPPNLEHASADQLTAMLRLQVAIGEARSTGRTLVADCLRGALRQLTAKLHAAGQSRGAILNVTFTS